MASHIIYIRKMFPYLDYLNKFLMHTRQDIPCLDLRVVVYTDISNMAFQLFSQNSRMLRRTRGFKGLKSHFIRFRIVYHLVCSVLGISDIPKKRVWAERLATLSELELFEIYRVLSLLLEWLFNNPMNIFIIGELKTASQNFYDKLAADKPYPQLDAEVKKQVDFVMNSALILTDSEYRHEMISLNDYARKPNKIVTSPIDDEMVLVELKRYFKEQTMWVEESRLHSGRIE